MQTPVTPPTFGMPRFGEDSTVNSKSNQSMATVFGHISSLNTNSSRASPNPFAQKPSNKSFSFEQSSRKSALFGSIEKPLTNSSASPPTFGVPRFGQESSMQLHSSETQVKAYGQETSLNSSNSKFVSSGFGQDNSMNSMNSKPIITSFGQMSTLQSNLSKSVPTAFGQDLSTTNNSLKTIPSAFGQVSSLSFNSSKPISTVFGQTSSNNNNSKNLQTSFGQISSLKSKKNTSTIFGQNSSSNSNNSKNLPNAFVEVSSLNSKSTVSSFDTPSKMKFNVLRQKKNKRNPESSSLENEKLVLSDEDNNLPQIKHNLESTENLEGKCIDMCSLQERNFRSKVDELSAFEKIPDGSSLTLKETVIKRFQRSSADHKIDIPEEVRPPGVLRKTQLYLETSIMDRERLGIDHRLNPPRIPELVELYNFVWDRSRMIRKDFTLMNYCHGGVVHPIAIDVYERIARYHILSEHELCEEEYFIAQQNMEQLGQTLKSLNEFYDETEAQGKPDLLSPCEAEFRAYYILCTIDNSGGLDVLKFLKSLSKKMLRSRQIQFALKVFVARTTLDFFSFISLLKQATYLNACLMHRYLRSIRAGALNVMNKAYSKMRYSVKKIQRLLVYEDKEQLLLQCQYHGILIEDDHLIFGGNFIPEEVFIMEGKKLPIRRSNLIDEKKGDKPRSLICRGKTEYTDLPQLSKLIDDLEKEERQRLYPDQSLPIDNCRNFRSSNLIHQQELHADSNRNINVPLNQSKAAIEARKLKIIEDKKLMEEKLEILKKRKQSEEDLRTVKMKLEEKVRKKKEEENKLLEEQKQRVEMENFLKEQEKRRKDFILQQEIQQRNHQQQLEQIEKKRKQDELEQQIRLNEQKNKEREAILIQQAFAQQQALEAKQREVLAQQLRRKQEQDLILKKQEQERIEWDTRRKMERNREKELRKKEKMEMEVKKFRFYKWIAVTRLAHESKARGKLLSKEISKQLNPKWPSIDFACFYIPKKSVPRLTYKEKPSSTSLLLMSCSSSPIDILNIVEPELREINKEMSLLTWDLVLLDPIDEFGEWISSKLSYKVEEEKEKKLIHSEDIYLSLYHKTNLLRRQQTLIFCRRSPSSKVIRKGYLSFANALLVAFKHDKKGSTLQFQSSKLDNLLRKSHQSISLCIVILDLTGLLTKAYVEKVFQLERAVTYELIDNYKIILLRNMEKMDERLHRVLVLLARSTVPQVNVIPVQLNILLNEFAEKALWTCFDSCDPNTFIQSINQSFYLLCYNLAGKHIRTYFWPPKEILILPLSYDIPLDWNSSKRLDEIEQVIHSFLLPPFPHVEELSKGSLDDFYSSCMNYVQKLQLNNIIEFSSSLKRILEYCRIAYQQDLPPIRKIPWRRIFECIIHSCTIRVEKFIIYANEKAIELDEEISALGQWEYEMPQSSVNSLVFLESTEQNKRQKCKHEEIFNHLELLESKEKEEKEDWKEFTTELTKIETRIQLEKEKQLLFEETLKSYLVN